ncbi:MAG: ABC transporter substrate-binding protein [Desulfobacterales bacterium]|nr:ABC transporter substrate-binding protein [Desulfobacterales bacterium]
MGNFRFLLTIFLFFLSTAVSLISGLSLAEDSDGISPKEILIGQSCALEGSARALGTQMKNGALIYFNYINSSGGIKGRNIKLISYDDGYEPELCKQNTLKLVEEDKVFLLFGYVGTPTSKNVLPIIEDKKIPFFAPFTGAEFLRNPLQSQVFNIRASYFQETEKMVEGLVNDLDFKKIAVFYQNDSYGQSGLEGVRSALAKRELTISSKSTYERNTLNVENAVNTIYSSRPEAVIMIGAYQPCAKFISMMRDSGSQAIFLNVSFVGGDSLGKILINKGVGVIISQVVPFPFYKKVPVINEYNKLKNEYMPNTEPNFVETEGFIAAKTLCKILSETTEPLTRKKFIETAEKQRDIDLGSFYVSFTPNSHNGSSLVYFTQIGPGGFLTPIKNFTQLYEYRK